MARITCAISGLRFNTSYLEKTSIPHTQGYFHPIFAVSYRELHHLYTQHTHGKLTSNDSYLLFIAFLHSSGQIQWRQPAALNPNDSRTKKLVENNLAQLVAVLEKSAVISHPSFTQPSFVVSLDNCHLEQISNWIEAWENNIEEFKAGRISQREYEDLVKAENKLSKLILSGLPPESFATVIADWAAKAGDFPPDKRELYKKTIVNCFSINKMFNTPLDLLKELKDFCECNIEAGSIHSHTLFAVIREGIFKHTDYLGGSTLALGYSLLPSPTASIADKENEAKANAMRIELQLGIIASAPENIPRAEDYKSKLDFIKAKLAYRVAVNEKKTANKIITTDNGDAL